MKITIDGTAKEIAELVLELQARQEDKPVDIKLTIGDEEIVKADYAADCGRIAQR